MQRHLPTIAWFSYFPIEWLPDAPDYVRHLPRIHPASWQRVLLEELQNISGLRLHILVLRKQFERDSTFERNGVTFHLMKTWGGLRSSSFFWLDTVLIYRKLAKIRPDVVHAWGTENGAALVASRLKYPYVVTVQGLLSWYKELVPLNRYQCFASFLEKWSLPRAPVATTESTFAVRYIQRRWPQLDVQQVEHAPDWIFHRLERKPQINPIRFLFVGSLSYIKGADLLFAALEQLKSKLLFELSVVGSPNSEFMEKIRAQTSAELWRRTEFKQNLRPEEIAHELMTATMMLFPTRADVSPNAVKEAVVAGVPVVGSNIGGLLDYVVPGRNGLLFQSGKIMEMVNAIQAACCHPVFSQGKVESETLARMRDYLSPMRMGRRFLEIYRAACRA
jgi:glycosyltransferase involved in cell wall biosynthesis